ncbi:MAG TPA: oligosaccharide flippase family protein [Planctomycetota bacterium]|nr:oligosaccharide flippase family protein [Planctomycetota bacterium]
MRGRVDGVLPHGSLRRRFARGAFWTVAGAIIAQVLGLAATIVVARLRGREIFGDLGMVRSTVDMLGVFGGLGLGLTATRFVAQYLKTDPERTGRIIGLNLWVGLAASAAATAAVLLLAPVIAGQFLGAPWLVVELRIGCAILFFESMIGTQNGVLSGLEAFRSIAKINLARGLWSFPLVLIGVYAWGIRGVLAGLGLASAAGWVMSVIVLRREVLQKSVPVVFRGVLREWAVLWRFTLPAFLNSLMVSPVLWLANRILYVTEGGRGNMGLYDAARRWERPVLFLSLQLGLAILPLLSSLDGDGRAPAKSGRVMSGTFAALAVVVLPVVALLACLAGPIMSFYGSQFSGAEAMAVLAAVLFVAGTKAFGNLSGMAIAARGAMWSGLLLNLIWAAVLLTFVSLWAKNGAVGFANAFAASYALSTVYGLLFVAFKGFMPWRLVVRVFVATVLVAAFSYGMLWAESIWLRLGLVTLATLIGVANAWFARGQLRAAGVALRSEPVPSTGEDTSCTF